MSRHLRTILLAASLSLSSLAAADTLKLSSATLDFYIDSPLANVDYKLWNNGLSMSMTGAPVTGDFRMSQLIRIVAHPGYAVNSYLSASIDHTTTTYGDNGTDNSSLAELDGSRYLFTGGIPQGVAPLTHTAHDDLNYYIYSYPGAEYFTEGDLHIGVYNAFNDMTPGQFSFSNFNIDLSIRAVPLPVPEADNYLMMLGGLALLGAVAQRRRQRRAV